jgi:hypothetical protein
MNEYNNNELFEGFEEEPLVEPGGARRKQKPRSGAFKVILWVLGALLVLALIVLGVVAGVILPQRNAARAQEAALINAANTATAMYAAELALAQQVFETQTAAAQAATDVPVEATATPPAPTPTLAEVEETLGATEEVQVSSEQELLARTQTVSALLTQAAAGPVPEATATALPKSGFADEAGLPVLFGMAILFVVVILAARKLRAPGAA